MPSKYLWRAARSLTIGKGNHGARGIDPAAVKPLPRLQILHAPLRAFDGLQRRIENARRLPLGGPPEQSWHLRRLLGLSTEELRWEWHANSTKWGGIGPPGRRARMALDLRLRRIAEAASSFVEYVFTETISLRLKRKYQYGD